MKAFHIFTLILATTSYSPIVGHTETQLDTIKSKPYTINTVLAYNDSSTSVDVDRSYRESEDPTNELWIRKDIPGPDLKEIKFTLPYQSDSVKNAL